MSENSKNNKASLLHTDEYAACKKISSIEGLPGKRAAALMALNEGQTQAQAAVKSGLTSGQVQYLVTQFKAKRMDIFPETNVSQVTVERPSSVEKKEKKKKEKSDKKKKGKKKSSKKSGKKNKDKSKKKKK